MHKTLQATIPDMASQQNCCWLASYTSSGQTAGSTLNILQCSDQTLLSTAADEHTTVLFDGVLYNPADLNARLADAGPIANPAQLILRAYQRWGIALLQQIKGIFALVIEDRERHSLMAARDPIGIFPLFYAQVGSQWFFSTSLAALTQHPAVSGAVNRAALADHLCHCWPDPEETFFQQVQRIPSGYVLCVDSQHQKSLNQYWDLPIPGVGCDWIREDELEQFDQLLAEAVDRCLSLGPAAIYLSGGLDSVSIAAIAATNSKSSGLPAPVALSLVFPEACSEAEIQSAVAARLGLPQVLLPFEQAIAPDGLLLSALKRSWVAPSPLLNPWEPAYGQLGLVGKQRGCRVILTGNGGDEWLGVTPLLAADLIRSFNFKDLYQLWSSLQRSYPIPPDLMAKRLLWQFGLNPLLSELKRASLGPLFQALIPNVLRQRRHNGFWQGQPDWMLPDTALRQAVEQRHEQSWERTRQQQSIDSFYFREVRAAFNHPLAAMEMEEIFESGNRLGLRILMPYWDVDLLTMLYRTPPQLLLRGGRSKGLVRESMARQFPRLGFERQKKVISIDFFNAMMLAEGRQAWETLGGTPALASLGIVDETRLEPAMAEIWAGQQQQQIHRVWDILNLEAWLQPRL